MYALEGITVVSLEHAIAAPLASRQLADQGARVIKVERPDGGDFARRYDGRARGLASHFVWVNRSKESICLNLKDPQDADVLARLILRADVFLQNLAPGVCASLGFGTEAIRALNPRCITCSISGYGVGGPYDGRKAYDLLIQGESGVLSVTGTDAAMCKAGIPVGDISAGMYAYSNILTALMERQRTGAGRHIEISMLDSLVEWMGYPLYYAIDGQPPPARTAAAHATIFPYGPYATADGKSVLIAVQNDREWQLFCTGVLRDEALPSAARYATNSQRHAAREHLQPLIAEGIAALTSTELIERLETSGIAFSRARSLDEVWAHPQLQARGRITQVDTPAGPMPALLPPGADAHEVCMNPVPALGEHTAAVLAWLDTDSSATAAARTQDGR
jgi:crotonobetainyl-CoA:carnitine CoA-transferase CaiB-like acyl-CoA transferase